MSYGLNRTTTPGPVLTTAEAKLHLRETLISPANDVYIDDLVALATKEVEEATNRQLITATWVLRLDAFPVRDGVLYLPRCPVLTVSSIAYVAVDAATDATFTTWSSSEYRLSITREPAEVTLAYGYTWPTPRAIRDCVVVTFTAGYGATGAHVDRRAVQAIREIVAASYQGRGDDDTPRNLAVPVKAERLIQQLKFGDMFHRYGVCA